MILYKIYFLIIIFILINIGLNIANLPEIIKYICLTLYIILIEVDFFTTDEKSKNILEKNKIYLLNLKVGAIKDNKKIYAVIFKKKENISHSHCIEATKIIQQIIKAEGYDEGDYTITVSSAGFRWKIENRFELFEDMPVKIKYKNEDKIITESGILKEAKEDYIILELENEIKKTIKIKDIIKARLNC